MRFGGEKLKIRTLEVSELNQYINRIIKDEPILSDVKVRGEISNLKFHSSGNIYLTLKDENSKINCMLQKNNISKNLKLEDGKNIIAKGYVSTYIRDGVYQLYIRDVEIEGVGKLYYEFLQLKEKLEKEGLFSPLFKKPIPKFPKNIGVVTSPTGAVIRDIINVISRRYPKVNIKLYPVAVQGINSAQTIVEGIEFLNKVGDIDTIIVGRGGGSLEELWSFNEEIVARAVHNSKIPIISAVGHETDYTICDFVSDMRAPTPSAAAEIATPDINDLRNANITNIRRIGSSVNNRVVLEREKLKLNKNNFEIFIQKNVLDTKYQELDNMSDRLNDAIYSILDDKKVALNLFAKSMSTLNPFSVLDRGYSIAEKDGVLVKKASELKTDEVVELTFVDDKVKCRVI